MKRYFQIVSLAIILFFTGCTKELSQKDSKNYDDPKFDSVVQFLKANFPEKLVSLNLKSNKELHYKDHDFGYQIFEKDNSKKFLLIRKDITGFTGNWIDLSGLNKNEFHKFSGKIQIQKLNGESKTDLKVENNNVIEIIKWNKSIATILPLSSFIQLKTIPNELSREEGNPQDYITLPEVIIVVNNQNLLSLFWLFNTYAAYNYYYIKDVNVPMPVNNSGNIGNAGPSSDNIIAIPVFNGPKTPIKNLVEEVKCFTNNLTSTYAVSVNVNQARPGSRDKVNPTNEFAAGHTFLTLEQRNSDGSKIVRNIGYYPRNSVYPGKYKDASVFGEDSDTPFAVSLKIDVNGSDFKMILNSLIDQQSKSYDIESFNCVTSVASALKKIDVDLPLTSSGISFVFEGSNPGDFGQDIRNLNLNTFSQSIGNKSVWRRNSLDNNLFPPPKTGSCN